RDGRHAARTSYHTERMCQLRCITFLKHLRQISSHRFFTIQVFRNIELRKNRNLSLWSRRLNPTPRGASSCSASCTSELGGAVGGQLFSSVRFSFRRFLGSGRLFVRSHSSFLQRSCKPLGSRDIGILGRFMS